ncbi:MAG TPA: hypothetical protein VGJ33_11980 [Candidatus Angelobacter sp.]|jgi:hypothetical protein
MHLKARDHTIANYCLAFILVIIFALAVVIVILPASAVFAQSCIDPSPPPPCDPDAPPEIRFGDQNGGAGTCASPIIIDITGDGFALTDATHGVKFDIANTGNPVQIAWTANANNAFLVFDRDGSGSITSGAELFGNYTPQPTSAHPNGFLALAVYDQSDYGGNGDGIIDNRDAIFSDLRLWVDLNHDGISQPNELFRLPDLGVFSISLDYRESRRTDQYGNLFRYRSKINVRAGERDQSPATREAYDIFLTTK